MAYVSNKAMRRFSPAGMLFVCVFLSAAPVRAASSPGDVVGKVTVGYQGWFACTGDGAPINGWWHWTNNWGSPPSPANQGIKSWPDMRDYAKSYQTAYANLGNGQGAKLFSSFDQSTVNTQFGWMHQYGIDCAALQRFNPVGGEGPTRDSMAAKVRIAAEANSVKFYIMYDATGWTSMQTQMKTDWTNKMSALTSSSMYAKQNGKPVVCIWGFGFNDSNHPWDSATCIDVVNWFKAQGCYVVGGVPREWRTGTGGSRPGFLGVYHAFNMLSPWLIGAFSDANGANGIYSNFIVPDQADCNANGVDYQPCVLPGDNSLRQRVHGNLMWLEFYNAIRAGCQGIYISMFDEFNEGNQITKTAADATTIPTGTTFVSLSDEDGTACSSDYYLRLTGDGGKMLKGQIALTSVRPTQPVASTGVLSLNHESTFETKCSFDMVTSKNGAVIRYSTPVDNSAIDIDVATSSGRVVRHFHEAGISSGQHSMQWNAGPQACGFYVVTMTLTGRNSRDYSVKSERIVLLKR
jgi:hypothetical protein